MRVPFLMEGMVEMCVCELVGEVCLVGTCVAEVGCYRHHVEPLYLGAIFGGRFVGLTRCIHCWRRTGHFTAATNGMTQQERIVLRWSES